MTRLVDLSGRRALVIATNHSALDMGRPTGVFASELTAAYYAFLDNWHAVDVASPSGGLIPVERLSVNPIIRTQTDDRLLPTLCYGPRSTTRCLLRPSTSTRTTSSIWPAAGARPLTSVSPSRLPPRSPEPLSGSIIGAVCHGPLGLINATASDGKPLVEGRHVTGVSNRQVRDLRITNTPQHPETELRSKGALYESSKRISDVLANHWVIDGNLVTGQNQNAGPMVARRCSASPSSVSLRAPCPDKWSESEGPTTSRGQTE